RDNERAARDYGCLRRRYLPRLGKPARLLIRFQSIPGQDGNVIEIILRGRYRFRKDKLKISIIDHLYRYWLTVDKERIAKHVCLVPLIISSLERERHVTTRQRVPIRKLQSVSKSDVD